MPIILQRQRELARVGNIRMGERKQPSRPGFQRDTFRFTSTNKAALEELRKAYGGKLIPWPERPGEWELDSQAGQISVIVDTTFSLDQNYLQHDGKTRTHKCDGVNCAYIEIERDRNKKIVKCVDHGVVPCLCDPDRLGADLNDDDRQCEIRTTLRVILPVTGDVMLWEFSSKGQIFNKEVFAAVETFRTMGMKQGYCLLSIRRLEKHRGNEVSKFGVASLTLDPNPPNFVASLLARTPEAQAQATLEARGGNAPALAPPAPLLDVATDTTKSTVEWMTKELGMKGTARKEFADMVGAEWVSVAAEARDKGIDSAAGLVDFALAKQPQEDEPEPVEGAEAPDEFADPGAPIDAVFTEHDEGERMPFEPEQGTLV